MKDFLEKGNDRFLTSDNWIRWWLWECGELVATSLGKIIGSKILVILITYVWERNRLKLLSLNKVESFTSETIKCTMLMVWVQFILICFTNMNSFYNLWGKFSSLNKFYYHKHNSWIKLLYYNLIWHNENFAWYVIKNRLRYQNM